MKTCVKILTMAAATAFVIVVFLILVGNSVYGPKPLPNRPKPHLNNWFLLSNRVVPISSYFDPRPQRSHNNSTVVLVSVMRTLKDSIVGCEVDGVTNINSLVEEVGIMEWVHARFKMSHTDCILYCWDMDVHENSVVKIIWTLNNETQIESVRTPLVTFSHGPEKDDVMVCATGFGMPAYLDQWLTYQRSVGVKLIHLNVEESFLQNLNTSVVLNDFIIKGIVRIVIWKEYLNSSQVYYYSQTLKYLDCIFRYQNSYRYMMMIDFDEYFMPAGKSKEIKRYITPMFKKNIGSLYIPTVVYSCKLNTSGNVMPTDGNITKIYDTNQFIFTAALGKSVHKIRTVRTIYAHKAENYFLQHRRENACRTFSQCRANFYFAHFSSYERHRKHCKPI